MKNFITIISVAGLVFLASCISQTNMTKRGDSPPLADANYTISGDTTGTGTVSVVSFIPSADPKYGAVRGEGGMSSLADPTAVSIAKFDALTKVESATSFMVTDVKIESEGSILSFKQKATVRGRAINYTGPAPVR